MPAPRAANVNLLCSSRLCATIPVENSATIRQPVGTLQAANDSLKKRGVKGRLVVAKARLYLRGTFTDTSGERKDRRIPLGVAKDNVLEGESRAVSLAAIINKTGAVPAALPWDAPTHSATEPAKALTVAESVELMRQDFWRGKARSSAAERTLERLLAETGRLPQQATLTMDLLVAVGGEQEPGTRTRQEFLKVAKRLAILVGIEGTDRLDALRTTYEPAERELPTEEQLKALLDAMPDGHQWSWPLWALITYGCRPCEVFSLAPAEDGTARCLTVKRKDRMPIWRTALALPVTAMSIERQLPWDVKTPQAYDSKEAARLNKNWGKWLGGKWADGIAPGLQLYDIRHAWAVRSIRKNLNASLAAKTMGHSLDVHHRTYHRWLDQADIAAVAASLS